jgi:hypothetical protein
MGDDVDGFAKKMWEKYGDNEYFYDVAQDYMLPGGEFLSDYIMKKGWAD